MIKMIWNYKKLKDYYNIKEAEVWLSLTLSIVFALFANAINVYENFSLYADVLKNIIICVIGGDIGLIGFSLSGISILIGLFTRKQVDLIEKNGKEGILQKVMSSYGFLAFSLAISAFIYMVAMLLICSKIIVTKMIFYLSFFVLLYLFLFNLFYTVSLVFNCISCFTIKRLYDNVTYNQDTKIFAQEIMINYLLKAHVEKENISKEKLLDDLENAIENIVNENDIKVELTTYFQNYFGVNKSAQDQ